MKKQRIINRYFVVYDISEDKCYNLQIMMRT